MESEKENTYGVRRSLVAKANLKAGTVLRKEHIAFKRPMNGLSPNVYEQILGKKLNCIWRKTLPFKKK